VSSGTAALMVGLRALIASDKYHIYEGARVLLPALTFIATANAVRLAGMRVMWGDIEPETMCLNPDEIKRGIFDIVMPVHLMGFGADMGRITELCEAHKPKPLILVEDASEAHGTTIGDKKAGGIGLWGAFSFYPAHTVQAGEFGCIVTDSAEIARVARQLKAHGRSCTCRKCTRSTTGCPQISEGQPDPRFLSQFLGWNFKPTEFSAALARVQLGHIEENINRRVLNRARLNTLLMDLDKEYTEFIGQMGAIPMAYPIILKRDGYRDRVVAELERRGVEARPLFGCIPTQQPSFVKAEDITWRKVPVAHRYGANGFYVGCHQYLTNEQVDYMAATIQDVIREVVT